MKIAKTTENHQTNRTFKLNFTVIKMYELKKIHFDEILLP